MIHGSVAEGTDASRSDVDRVVVADTLTLEVLYSAPAPIEARPDRRIRPPLYTGTPVIRSSPVYSAATMARPELDNLAQIGCLESEPPDEIESRGPFRSGGKGCERRQVMSALAASIGAFPSDSRAPGCWIRG